MKTAYAGLLAALLLCPVSTVDAQAQISRPVAQAPAEPAPQAPAQAVAPSAQSPAPSPQAVSPAPAAPPPTAVSTPIADLSARIDGAAEQLAQPLPTEDTLTLLRDDLETVRAQARAWIAEQVPNVERAQSELDALGPAPGEGEEPETASVAAQRQDLKARLAQAAGPIKEAELIVERANRLLSEIGSIRRQRFAETVMARGPSPLSPVVWGRALPVLASIAQSLAGSVTDILASAVQRDTLRRSAIILAAVIGLAIILVWPMDRWLLRRYGRDPAIAQPSFMQAVRATLVIGVARALLPTAAAAMVYFAAVGEGLLTEAGKEIGRALFQGVLLFTWVVAFFRASLSPARPNWRILTVPTRFAVGVQGIVIALAFAFAVDIVLSEIIVTYNARLAVTSLRDYLLTVVVTVILLVLLLRQKMWIPEGDDQGNPRWRTMRILVAMGLLQMPVLGGLGYVSLARFIVSQLVLSGGMVILVLILHRLGREFIRNLVSAQASTGVWLRDSLSMDAPSTRRFEFWFGLGYDTILGLLAIVVGLFVWGAEQQDVAEWVYLALFGFKVGRVTFSLIDLSVAIALFVGLFLATRFVRRMLAEQILPQTRLDVGLRQSIPTVVGYAGVVLAAAAGISALGLDLSNLAIVAGALSVGIGFGLQNVVNNFVSGLILLAERPIKVGDWVIVGDKEGYVRRINVRATEIQTFDRATVFVPNSQLISEAVTNWTYADKLGRVIIPVGVAYGCDTKLVQETLLEIAKAHPAVLGYPEPVAVFRGFGDSALNFELRCFLQNVEMTIIVTSDLCFAIDEAFRKKGIEIPFPQRDIHVRQGGPQASLPGVPEDPQANPTSPLQA